MVLHARTGLNADEAVGHTGAPALALDRILDRITDQLQRTLQHNS
jgi:hypothetical protein